MDDADASAEWDTDVTQYTLEELAEALGVSPTATRMEITLAADAKVRALLGAQPELATFFEQAKVRLLSLLSQDLNRPITRLLNLDSAYRPVFGVDNQDTDNYTCTLSERLTGVLSITLLSMELPQTWYTFSQAKGTTAFVFQSIYNATTDGSTFTEVAYSQVCTIPDGNYSNLSLVALVQAALNAAVAAIPDNGADRLDYGEGPWFALAQDPANGKLSITMTGLSLPKVVKLVWYDPTQTYPELANARSNSNLGWELGFRTDSTALTRDPTRDPVSAVSVTVTAPSLISAIGTRYVLLRLKDHTSGRLSNGAITLGAPNLNVVLPPYSRTRRGAIDREVGTVLNLPQASGEQQLTAKQLYTINAISNRVSIQSGRTETQNTDLFAKIPVKRQTDWSNYSAGVLAVNEDGPGKLFVELGGTLQKNKRVYAGPVNLSTLTVSLHDDRGNLLGLNGHDWSCSLELETLPPS